MAKSTQIRVAETDDETETRQAAEDLAALNAATGGDLFTAIEELRQSTAASGTICLVTRIASEGKSGGYCGKLAISDFSLDKIKSLFGPGRYMVQIKGPKGFVPGGNAVEIADTGESAAPAAAAPARGEFQSYIEYMQREQAERRAKLNDLLAISIPTLGTVLTAIFTRSNSPDLTTLITALKPPPGPSITDLTKAMIDFRELSSPAKASGGDPVDTVLKVFEAARDMSDGSGASKGGSNWIDILRDLIKEAPAVAGPVFNALRAQAQARAGARQMTGNIELSAPPRATPAAPALETAAAPSAAPAARDFAGDAGPKSGDADMLMLMKPAMIQKLKLIGTWAAQNKNAQVYAELFLIEHVPANLPDYLPPDRALEYLNNADWFKYVCDWEPSLAPHRDWCDMFRQELIAIISMPPPANDNGSNDGAIDTEA